MEFYIEEIQDIIKSVTYDISKSPNKTTCTIELINGEIFIGEYNTFGTHMSISFFKKGAYDAAIREIIVYLAKKSISSICKNNSYGIKIPMSEFISKFNIGVEEKNISDISIKNHNIEIKLT